MAMVGSTSLSRLIRVHPRRLIFLGGRIVRKKAVAPTVPLSKNVKLFDRLGPNPWPPRGEDRRSARGLWFWWFQFLSFGGGDSEDTVPPLLDNRPAFTAGERVLNICFRRDENDDPRPPGGLNSQRKAGSGAHSSHPTVTRPSVRADGRGGERGRGGSGGRAAAQRRE